VESILLIGFDSAWTAKKSGALVGTLYSDDGTLCDLGPPQRAKYSEAEKIILQWQNTWKPQHTVIMVDQPTIVKNSLGQRPVENIVGSLVSLRYGGMQPANTSKKVMFGKAAPVWQFLNSFGGAANPLVLTSETLVLRLILCWPSSHLAGCRRILVRQDAYLNTIPRKEIHSQSRNGALYVKNC
jgi:predicted RNase H-like nuclease